MNTADLDAGATIGFAGAAGDTISAIEVGDERDDLTFAKIRRTIDVDQLSSQFVTQDAGIIKKRLRAFEGMKVGTANSDALYFQEGMIFG